LKTQRRRGGGGESARATDPGIAPRVSVRRNWIDGQDYVIVTRRLFKCSSPSLRPHLPPLPFQPPHPLLQPLASHSEWKAITADKQHESSHRNHRLAQSDVTLWTSRNAKDEMASIAVTVSERQGHIGQSWLLCDIELTVAGDDRHGRLRTS
jgi:hypothetical protein